MGLVATAALGLVAACARGLVATWRWDLLPPGCWDLLPPGAGTCCRLALGLVAVDLKSAPSQSTLRGSASRQVAAGPRKEGSGGAAEDPLRTLQEGSKVQSKGFSFFFTNSPLTVEGYHSVVTLFVPFFKLGSDSKFDPSKDLSSCAAASPCSSLSHAASMCVFS